MNTRALRRAVKIAGGQTALGKRLGLSQRHIWNWLNRDKRVPAERVISVETAVDGAVSRHELRPDIYPDAAENLKAVK